MALPIPEGFHSVNVLMIVSDSEAALDLYARAFGAETVMRVPGPDGQGTMHAETRIGDCIVMLTDENEAWNAKTPNTLGGTPVGLYVDDVDAVFAQACEAGMEVMMPPADQFYGDRSCRVKDPWGHEWSIGSHIEDVEPDEIERRMAEQMAKGESGEPRPGDEGDPAGSGDGEAGGGDGEGDEGDGGAAG